MKNITESPRMIPLGMKRNLFFSKQVTQQSIVELTNKIIAINEDDRFLEKLYVLYDLEYKPKPIKIFIDSYGGRVYQIMGLISIIENSITPVYTYCTGAAMSCGFILLISGHKRFCYKHGTPLYHQVSTSFSGKTEDMEQKYAETKRLQDKIEELTIRKTKISKETLDANRTKKVDWYMTAEEAKTLGVVDEVI